MLPSFCSFINSENNIPLFYSWNRRKSQIFQLDFNFEIWTSIHSIPFTRFSVFFYMHNISKTSLTPNIEVYPSSWNGRQSRHSFYGGILADYRLHDHLCTVYQRAVRVWWFVATICRDCIKLKILLGGKHNTPELCHRQSPITDSNMKPPDPQAIFIQ